MHLKFMDSWPDGKRGFGRWDIIDNEPSLVFFVAEKWFNETQIVLQFNVYNPLFPVNKDEKPVSIALHPEEGAADAAVPSLELDQSTVLKVPMDYDLTTVLDVVGAVAGDAHPLEVYPARFTHLEINQSTSVPKEVSTVSIRFATSLPLGVNNTLELTFPGILESDNVWQTAPGVLPLAGPDPSFFRADSYSSAGTACWSDGRPRGSTPFSPPVIKLMLYVARVTVAGYIYEVSIDLTNPLPVLLPPPA